MTRLLLFVRQICLSKAMMRTLSKMGILFLMTSLKVRNLIILSPIRLLVENGKTKKQKLRQKQSVVSQADLEQEFLLYQMDKCYSY